MRLLRIRISLAFLIAAAGLNAVPPAGAQVVDGYEVTVYSTLPGPTGLDFDAAGNLYVGQDAPASGAITEQFVRRVPSGGGAALDYGPFGLPDPRGVWFDATPTFASEAGALVVSGPVNGTSGQTVAILPSELAPIPGAMVQTLHAAGSGGATAPSYMELGPGGLLIVDPPQKALLQLVAPALTLTPLVTSTETPRFVAVSGADIFVSYDTAIRKYDAAGTPTVPDFASGLDGPLPIAVSPGGDFPAGLYAIETGTGRLLSFDAAGVPTELGDGFPANLGEIEFGADGALYVASFSAGQILRVALPEPDPPLADLGPYLCYNAKTSPDGDPFAKRTEAIEDAFDTSDARIGKPKALCNPAEVSGGGIAPPLANGDTEARLASHQVRRVPAVPLAPQTLPITNALGGQTLTTLAAVPDRLLLPSAVATAAPTPLPATSPARDAYQCYKARPATGSSFAPVVVTVEDGAGTAMLSRDLRLNKPRHLCMPAVVLPGTIGRPGDLLVCYAVKRVRGQPQAPVVAGLHVANEIESDYEVDLVSGSRTTTSAATRTGRTSGDVVETFVDEGRTRPGEWDLEDSEGPRWAGGGPLAEDAESLKASFSDALGLGDDRVRRWRLFVEIDIAVNDTDAGPGVVMRASGIPGIPDGTEARAMAHGKPAGLRATTAFFEPPSGTLLSDLVDGDGETPPELIFEANGDDSAGAFAFQVKRFGIEYEAIVSSQSVRTGLPESELCLPSTTP
jgi:hypothetical protein